MGSGGSKKAPPKANEKANGTGTHVNSSAAAPKPSISSPKDDTGNKKNNISDKSAPAKTALGNGSTTTPINNANAISAKESFSKAANEKGQPPTKPLQKATSLKFQESVSKTLMQMTREKTLPKVALSRTSASPILIGDVGIKVPPTGKIVRIFTSSTFTDTMHERNMWMREAYPQLRTYCQARGYEFQVVDMRWGVRDEAGDDHTTGDLCLNELKLCQQLSTGPNFISLLANKYGYRNLPRTIDVDEFHILIGGVENESSKELLERWYIRDDNAVPPEFVLQPISKYIPDYRKKTKAANDQWYEEECDMQDTLELSARKLLEEKKAEKYYTSITEKEVKAGLLDTPESAGHCLWFWRKISDIENMDPDEHDLLKKYIDSGGKEEFWRESRRLLNVLETTKMKPVLPEENIHQYTVNWTEKGLDPDYSEHNQYLKKMTAMFVNEMKRVINKGIEERSATEMTDPLMIECCQHIRFCKEKCENFCGRAHSLEKIKTYMKSKNDKPFVIHGASGCGKTSLLAMTAKLVPSWMSNTGPAVVFRFIGTTPDSSNISGLLISIISQIKAIYGDVSPMPETLQDLANELDFVLSFAKPSLPLIVLLDSLDQMDISNNARSLFWLPRTLSKNVKIIVSTLEDEEYECFPKLKAMFKEEEQFIAVPALKSEDAATIIQQWLHSRNRTLTSEQLLHLTETVNQCPLPLFLKLSFENAQRWHSYWDKSETVLQKTIRNSINDLFSKLEGRHGQIFVSRTLGYLTVSRNGLSESELEDILSCDDDVLNDVYQFWVPPSRRLPPLLLVRLKTDIQQYIVERGSDRIRVVYWYHRQFIETAKARYCGNAITTLLHKGLADFFSGKWSDGKEKPYVDKKKKPGRADRHVTSQPLTKGDTYNVRKLNNLPYHRSHADNVNELKEECLMNFSFLQAKVAATSVRHVLDDFAFARKRFPKDRELESVGEAFEMSQGALLYDPLQLAPQLLDRLSGEQHTSALLSQCEHCNVPYLMPDQDILMKPGGQLIFCLTGHQGPVLSIDIRKDGKVAASCADDSEESVKTWDLREGKLLKSYDGLGMNPTRVRFVHKDKFILVDYQDSLSAIQETGEIAFSVESVGGQTAVGGKENSLLATFSDKQVVVYSLENGDCISTVEISASELDFCMDLPSAIAVSQNYAILTDIDQHYITEFSFKDRALCSWVQIFSPEKKSGKTDLTVDAIVITPDEKQFILSNISDNNLHIYSRQSKEKLKTIKGFRMDFAQNYRITQDGNFLYFPGDFEIVVWNLQKEQRSCILTHPGSLKDAVCWSWKIMVTATDDTTVRVWDLSRKEKESKNQSRILGHKIRHFVPMKNPRYAVVLAQMDRADADQVSIQVYDVATKQVVRESSLDVPPGVIKILDDTHIVVVTSTRKIKTIDLESMKVDKVFDGELSVYTIDIQVKYDGSEIITHTRGRQYFKLYNARNGRTTSIMKRPSSLRSSKQDRFEEAFQVNKSWTVLAGRVSEGPWVLFDVQSHQCIKVINPQEYPYNDVAIEISTLTDDGQIFAFGVESSIGSPGVSKEKYKFRAFQIWDVRQNQRLAVCEDTEFQSRYFETENRKGIDVSVDEIHALDADRLVTTHDDFVIRVWNRQTGELLNRLNGHNSPVTLFLTENGPYFFSFATYEEENAIRVWETSTLECLASYRLDHTVVSTRICADNKHFLSSTKSPTSRLIHWRLEGTLDHVDVTSFPILFKGKVSSVSLALVTDDDDLATQNDPDTDEDESDEDGSVE